MVTGHNNRVVGLKDCKINKEMAELTVGTQKSGCNNVVIRRGSTVNAN